MPIYGFLSNDSLPTAVSPAVEITFSIDSGPSNGTLYTWPAEGDPVTGAADADGSFRYVPNAGFSGQDSFDYTVYQDGTPIDSATCTITVSAAASGDWPPAPGDPDPSVFPRLSGWCLSNGPGSSRMQNMADRSGTTPGAWAAKYHIFMWGLYPGWSRSETGWSYANPQALVDEINTANADTLNGHHDNISEIGITPTICGGSGADYTDARKLSVEDWTILGPDTRNISNITVQGSSTLTITFSPSLDLSNPSGIYQAVTVRGVSGFNGTYPVESVNVQGAATQVVVTQWAADQPYGSYGGGGTINVSERLTAFGDDSGQACLDETGLTPDGSGDHWKEWFPANRASITLMNGNVKWDVIGSDQILATAALSGRQDFNRDGVADDRDASDPQYASWRDNNATCIENMVAESAAAGNARARYTFMHFIRYQHSGLTAYDLAGCGENLEYRFRAHANQAQFLFGENSLLNDNPAGSWTLKNWEFAIKFVVKCRYYLADPKFTFWDATHDISDSAFDNGEAAFASDNEAMRFSFASCLLTDAYFVPAGDDGNAEAWWWDECDNAGASDKWMGAPVDGAIADWPAIAAAGGANSTNNLVVGGANRLANGVYYRRFANAIAMVNPPGNGTQITNMSQIDSATYQRIDASGAPSDGRVADDGYNDGSVVNTFSFGQGRGVILRRIP